MDAVLPIYFQIKQTIRGWIVNRQYNPGEKIPSEAELMAQFKVSRLTVRQAISQLVQEGLLISTEGRGLVAAPTNEPSPLLDISNPSWTNWEMACRTVSLLTLNWAINSDSDGILYRRDCIPD